MSKQNVILYRYDVDLEYVFPMEQTNCTDSDYQKSNSAESSSIRQRHPPMKRKQKARNGINDV